MQQLRTKGKRITSRRRCRSLLPCYAGVGMGTGTTDWNLEGTNGTDDAGKKCGASRSRPQPDPATYYLTAPAAALLPRADRAFVPQAATDAVAVPPPGGGVPPQAATARTAAPLLVRPQRPPSHAGGCPHGGAPAPPARPRPAGGRRQVLRSCAPMGCRRVVPSCACSRARWRAVCIRAVRQWLRRLGDGGRRLNGSRRERRGGEGE
ncbi:hypothetical protein DAI22_06g053300 [Oryza sativa Japonica Group]|nr:hypothetical protein DAI22_06g053300 [Oryza sativa Japonica Group]